MSRRTQEKQNTNDFNRSNDYIGNDTLKRSKRQNAGRIPARFADYSNTDSSIAMTDPSMHEPVRRRPSILRYTSLKRSGSSQASSKLVVTSTTSIAPLTTLPNISLDAVDGSSISFVNLTGDVIQLVPISAQPENTNGTTVHQKMAKGSKNETVIRLAPSTAAVLSTAKPDPTAPPNPMPVTPLIRSSVRPCCVCETSTNNTHANIVTCPRCETIFHRMFDDLGELKEKCGCAHLPSMCSNCRLYNAATKTLFKLGASWSDRAKREWSLLDRSLDALSKTTCTLEDIVRVNDEELACTYGSPKSLLTPSSSGAQNNQIMSLDQTSAMSSKRIAIDDRFWVSVSSLQLAPTLLPATTPTASTSLVSTTSSAIPSHCVVTSTTNQSECPNNSAHHIISSMEVDESPGSSTNVPFSLPPGRKCVAVTAFPTKLPPILPKGPLPVVVPTPSTSGNSHESLKKTPKLTSALMPAAENKSLHTTIPLSPTASLSSAFTQDEILARRLSRLVRANFAFVHKKHCNTKKHTTSVIADVAMDNHATLFQLFQFYDWEWNQPVEVSASVRQTCWSAFHVQLNDCLTDMVRFIKRIPGFPILKPQDRILLVRHNGFELAFLVHYLKWNTDHGTWHGPDSFVLTLDQLITIFPSGELFFRHAFANAERLCLLCTDLQHLGLLAALVVLNTYVPSLSDLTTVDALYQRMVNAIKFNLEARQLNTLSIMECVNEAVSGLRNLGDLHRQLLIDLKDENHLEFPDDLYAELFELISD